VNAGGHFGEAVWRSVQDGGDPADFVVLTNNDYEEHPDFSAKDFDGEEMGTESDLTARGISKGRDRAGSHLDHRSA